MLVKRMCSDTGFLAQYRFARTLEQSERVVTLLVFTDRRLSPGELVNDDVDDHQHDGVETPNYDFGLAPDVE